MIIVYILGLYTVSIFRLIPVIGQAGFKSPEDTYFTWNSSFSWMTSQTNAVDKMFLMSFKSFVNTGNRRLMKKVLIARKLAIEPPHKKPAYCFMRKTKAQISCAVIQSPVFLIHV